MRSWIATYAHIFVGYDVMRYRGAAELQLVGKSLRAVLDGSARGGGGKPLFPAGLEAEKT